MRRANHKDIIPPPFPEGTTERVYNPFWSPNGSFVGFLTPGSVNRIAADGKGFTQTIWSPQWGSRGAAWNCDGVIIIPNSLTGGLLRVPASGGAATVRTTVVPANSDLIDRLRVVSHSSVAVRARIYGAHRLAFRLVSEPYGAPAGDSRVAPPNRGSATLRQTPEADAS